MRKTYCAVERTGLGILFFLASLLIGCYGEDQVDLPNRSSADPEYINMVFDGVPVSFVPPQETILYDTFFFSPPPPYTRTSSITGIKGPVTSLYDLNFSFDHNFSTGIYPTSGINMQVHGPLSGQYYVVGPRPDVNITHIDPFPMGFIEGNFAATVRSNGPIRTMTVSFRVRRN